MSTNHYGMSRILASRLSRRRAIVATGASAVAAAFLTACGRGSDGASNAPVDKSGLLSPRTDETNQAVAGGTWPITYGNNAVFIDPNTTFNGAAFSLIAPVYSALVKYGKAIGKLPGPETITGDAMESWEVSPDGLQITYKLRPNHSFDPRPPTNGRAMTTDDIKFSWDRTAALSPTAPDFMRDKGPTGPAQSLTVTDDKTVVLKLAEPYGAINEMLAYWYLWIAPVEADSKFDPKSEARGSGPFRLDKWTPSVSLEYKRNPNWYVKNQPFLDGMIFYNIPEQATVNAQFEARQLWTAGGLNAQDILRIKRQYPELVMRQEVLAHPPSSYPMLLGTYFQKDQRLRQAVSMLYDRDTLLNTVNNVDIWSQAGLDVTTFWDGHLSNDAINWIDPKNEAKDLGEGAKYFQFNPTEAKKLLDAAGYNGETIDFQWRDNFGPAGVMDILSNMIEEGGMEIQRKALTQTDWRNYKGTFGAGFSGMMWSTANSFNDDGFLTTKYVPGNKDNVIPNGIPGISDAILKMRAEADARKRNEMIRQIQRDLAVKMPDMPVVGLPSALTYTLRWPWFRNDVFSVPGFSLGGSTARPFTAYWYDKAKQS